MSTKTFIAVLAAVAFLGGWIALGTPTSVVAIEATGATMECGSALAPNSRVQTLDEVNSSMGFGFASVEGKCDSALAPRKTIGWSLVAVGAVAGVGAGLAIRAERKRSATSASTDGAVASSEPQ